MNKLAFIFLVVLVAWGCKDPEPAKPAEQEYQPTPVTLDLPYLFPKMVIPADNPLTEEGIALGRKLFYEPMLSGNGTQSCADCHMQNSSFTDPARFSIGIDGLSGKRNAMPVINVGWMDKLFWDGRANGVEDQATFPVVDPLEMHADWDQVVEKLKAIPSYQELFRKAFKTSGITKDRTVKAIAQFERTMVSYNSKTDKVAVIGGGVFYSDLEQEGFDLFNSERGDCFHCHSGILFTDNLFHNNG
ncbi:MAG TPA: cytochrome-c peroxidase, partial [Saprospiraceae bacterium]|nr:cytochrome-c peroxidase [Saprospiraceae bacterium]